MTFDKARVRLRLAVGLFLVILLVPVSAKANDMWTTLVPPCSSAGDLVTSTPPPGVPFPVKPSWFRGFYVHVEPGQTLVATLTTSPGVGDPDFRVSGEAFLIADAPKDRVQVLAFSAEDSRTCYLMVDSSNPGTYTLDLAVVPPLNFTLSGMKAPKTARRRKAFTISMQMSDYDGFIDPIRFILQRRLKGKWKPFSSAAGEQVYGADGIGHWKYTARLRLQRGTYRVRARFKDMAHPTPQYNRWATVVVR